MKKLYSLLMLAALVGAASLVGVYKNVLKSDEPKDRALRDRVFNMLRNDDVESMRQVVDAKLIDVNQKFEGKGGKLLGLLDYAMHFKSKKIIYYLVAVGADLRGYPGKMSPLDVAITYYLHGVDPDFYREIIEFLVHSGAPVDTKVGGATPLHLAVYGGSVDFVKLLTSAGADVNARNQDGLTPLFLLMVRDNFDNVAIEIARLLLDAGADPNYEVDGLTPLYAAVREDNPNYTFIKMLIDAGADLSARDEEGRTPFDVAENDQIKRLLQEAMEAEHFIGGGRTRSAK